MECIERERWKSAEGDPGRQVYEGQRSAAEVFAELCGRLQSQGYLPDAYFLLDGAWANGREIPKGADIFCTTEYGGNEGVYIDVYLKWRENEESITSCFATGKTLGESGSDLDRMFLTASAITKAFYGDRAAHARFVQVGGSQEDTGGSVVHLSAEEQKTILDALLSQREQQEAELTQTEQLLRRMTGSVTAYMDTVGQRPLHISPFDKAVIAVRDGELSTFKELLSQVHDRADELLIETAGRPGAVGRKMTVCLMEKKTQFSESSYQTACQRAVDIHDTEKVCFLLEQANAYVEALPRSFHGEMAQYAYRESSGLARSIIQQCTPEQIAAAPSRLLYTALLQKDYPSARTLAQKGIRGDECFADAVRLCALNYNTWQIEALLVHGLNISNENYAVLGACVEHDLVKEGRLLIDRGMEFERFQAWARRYKPALLKEHVDTLDELKDYSTELKQAEQKEQTMGGMTFG